MKTREEQLKEMAKLLCSSFNSEYCHHDCPEFCDCRVLIHCEGLQYAGYRKQSDTVKEFVERLKQSLIDLYPEKNEKISLPDLEIDGIDIEMTINKLAAEYGAEVEK